jgi:hypothetical protein
MTGQPRSPTSSSRAASTPAALRHAPEVAGGRRGVLLTSCRGGWQWTAVRWQRNPLSASRP